MSWRSPNKWCDLYWTDSWRFVYSPSISDCSTIIDDDLDSELEFLASASSVMVNPVLPYTRDVLTQLAPLQMHFFCHCLIMRNVWYNVHFSESIYTSSENLRKIWWIWFDFRLLVLKQNSMETNFRLRILTDIFLNVYVAIQNAEGRWSMLLGSTKWPYYTFIC